MTYKTRENEQSVAFEVANVRLKGTLLALSLVLFASFTSFAQSDDEYSDSSVEELPQSTSRRTPGLYLSPRDRPGRVSTDQPLAPLDTKQIVEFLRQHPDLQQQRIVLSLPSLLKGKEFVAQVKTALQELGIQSDVELIRFPNGSVVESVLDLFPRRQDLAAPLAEEISTGHVMVFGGEALSMSLLAYLVVMNEMSVAMGAGVVALDLLHQSILTYPVRSLSLYQSRQSNARQFLINVFIGLVMSSNYFLLMNSADLSAAMPKYLVTVIPGAVVNAVWSNTALTAFKWEAAQANSMSLDQRRILRSRALLLQQFLLSPFYLYSVAPFAHTLYEANIYGINVLNVNAGHLVILGAGLASSVTWLFMEKIAEWTSQAARKPGLIGSCLRLFSGETKKAAKEGVE